MNKPLPNNNNLVKSIKSLIWSRWRKEYLANLAIRQKWHFPKRNIQIGDIVIVKDDDLPTNQRRLLTKRLPLVLTD